MEHGHDRYLSPSATLDPVVGPHGDSVRGARRHLRTLEVRAATGRNHSGQPLAEGALDVAMEPALAIAVRLRRPADPEPVLRVGSKVRDRRRWLRLGRPAADQRSDEHPGGDPPRQHLTDNHIRPPPVEDAEPVVAPAYR